MYNNRQGKNNSNYKHGLTGTRLFNIYNGMKRRCYNMKDKYDYPDYGGRGIKICEEWLIKENSQGFINFYNWALDNGYKDDLSLDRINVNGNYEPNNCRWTTWKTQANNKTNNVFIEYKGETKTISEWSILLSIPYDTLYSRLFDYNIPVNEAFTMEYISRSDKQKLFTYNNETHNLYEWSKILNIDYGTLKLRARKHDDVNEIFKTPKDSSNRNSLHKINNVEKTIKEWSSEYNISYDMLKYRVYRKHMTIEEALKDLNII